MDINVICIIMQFGPLNITEIPPKYIRFITCLQCQWSAQRNNLQQITMMAGELRLNPVASAPTETRDIEGNHSDLNQASLQQIPSLKRASSVKISDCTKKNPKSLSLMKASSNPIPQRINV